MGRTNDERLGVVGDNGSDRVPVEIDAVDGRNVASVLQMERYCGLVAKHRSSSISCSRVPCCFSADFCGLKIDDVDEGELEEEVSDSAWEIVVEMRRSEGPVASGEIDSMSWTWASDDTVFSVASAWKGKEGTLDVVGTEHKASISFATVALDAGA